MVQTKKLKSNKISFFQSNVPSILHTLMMYTWYINIVCTKFTSQIFYMYQVFFTIRRQKRMDMYQNNSDSASFVNSFDDLNL